MIGISHGRQIETVKRMRDLAQNLLAQGKFVVADFVCPTPKQDKILMQTILSGSIPLKREDLMIQIKCL